MGREVVISVSPGMIAVLGAYLVQVGDLTRTVHLASLPLVVATGLWVWIDELITRADEEQAGRRTLVIDFGRNFSGRYGVLALALLFFATLLVAVISASLSPLALVTLLSSGRVRKIVAVSWTEHLRSQRMIRVREDAF